MGAIYNIPALHPAFAGKGWAAYREEMSRRSRSRLERMRDRRQSDHSSDGAIAAVKFAGFGAAVVIFLGVAVGFRPGALADQAADLVTRLDGLLRPLFLGLSLLELALLAAGLTLAAVLAWRWIRR